MAIDRIPTDMIVDRTSGVKLSASLTQKAKKIVVYLSDYDNLKVVNGSDYDYSPCLQTAIKDVMNAGGGTIKCEAVRYTFFSTVYTHPSNMDITNFKFSPLTIEGVTPVNAGLYNTTKNITRFVMKGTGSLLGVNFNDATECVITSVYRNFTIKNIGFYGGGTLDTKYTQVYASTLNVKGVEKRNASINVEDCYFWAMDWGIYDPETVLSVDNYCDQSTYRRLTFEAMGTGWIQAYRSDSSIFEAIYGYDMAKTCQYGVRAKKGESFEITKILCAGKAMHLAPNFKMVNLEYCNSVAIREMYIERIEGNGFYLSNSKNITIEGIGVRHYAKTIGKGVSNRSVVIKNVYTHVEEGKVLSASDTGNYATYDTITSPADFDFDNTNTDIRYENTFFRNGVHPGDGTFTETTARLTPKLNTTSKAVYQLGKQYIFDVINDGTNFMVSLGSGQVAFGTLFSSSNPTFNTGTGELTFPTDGAFTNISVAHVSGRRSGTGIINNAYKVGTNPLVVRLLTTAGAIITTPADVAFSVTLHT